MPDAAVGKLDEQPDEEHAFGPTAPLVAEWMRLRCLPITLLRDTHPLDDPRRANHVR